MLYALLVLTREELHSDVEYVCEVMGDHFVDWRVVVVVVMGNCVSPWTCQKGLNHHSYLARFAIK